MPTYFISQYTQRAISDSLQTVRGRIWLRELFVTIFPELASYRKESDDFAVSLTFFKFSKTRTWIKRSLQLSDEHSKQLPSANKYVILLM